MAGQIFKLILVSLIPVVFTIIFESLLVKTKFGKTKKWIQQVTIGVTFGGIAVLGTELGIPLNGYVMNARDAAVLAAGLIFGGPAGIIAGVIGGVERYFAVNWGAGAFTREACALATLLAGVYSAALRKFLFENKRPGSLIALAIGVVIEVFHMTLALLFKIDQMEQAIEVVKACSVPMGIANGVSVMLSTFAVYYMHVVRKEKTEEKQLPKIHRIVQTWLLVSMVIAFTLTTIFVINTQKNTADNSKEQLLTLACDELIKDVQDASDENLLSIGREIAKEIEYNDSSDNFAVLLKKYNISEIDFINKNGIITHSTKKVNIGFDMHSGSQAAEFLCLLDGKTKEFSQPYGPITRDENVFLKYAGIAVDDGFIQVAYDSELFQSMTDKKIANLTTNRLVGKTGFIFIADRNFSIVSAPNSFSDDDIKLLDGFKWTYAANQQFFDWQLHDEDFSCRCKKAEGYYILAMITNKEAYLTRDVTVYINCYMEILVFAIMFGLIYKLIKVVVIDNLHNVNKSLAKITAGDLNEEVKVNNSYEFNELSRDINLTVGTLKNYIAEASARIDKELELAKDIQNSALPSVFPAFPKRKDLDIYALMNAAKSVGGDFYDFYITKNDQLNFLVADVSGKGIPAAMFMMRAKTELKSLTEADLPINEVFTKGNHALCEGNEAGMFVTAWQGGIDLNTGIVKFVNAGHNPPLIKRANGKFEYLKTRCGLILAGMDGMSYREEEVKLEPGDILYLYTDGVTEATNTSVELYGEDRLKNALNTKEFDSMEELCKFVKTDVDNFVGEAPQFDDITMLAFKYLGKPTNPSICHEQASIADIAEITEFIEQECEKHDVPMKTVIQMNVALDEIYSNIVKYGYANTTGPTKVEFLYDEEESTIGIKFVDSGIPYNPLHSKDPDVTLSAEERQIGGLGIYMVKKTMDDIKYYYEKEQNILIITKKI